MYSYNIFTLIRRNIIPDQRKRRMFLRTNATCQRMKGAPICGRTTLDISSYRPPVMIKFQLSCHQVELWKFIQGKKKSREVILPTV